MSRKKGFKHSEITKQKMKDNSSHHNFHLGVKKSEKFKLFCKKRMMGDKNPAKRLDVREKIRIKALGRIMSEKTKEKMKKRIVSDQWRKNQSNRMSGINNPRYQIDRTKLKQKENRKSFEYDNWEKEIKQRDNYKCRLLNNECYGRLEAHHIFNWKDYKELRYIINNGITLCIFHHPHGRDEEKRMIPIFQELLLELKNYE